MSYAWSFQSFSWPKFQQLFGQANPDQAAQLASAATAVDRQYGLQAPEVRQSIEDLFQRLAMYGLDYKNLTEAEARIVDEHMVALFNSDELSGAWEVEPLSPDGVHPTVIEELIRRAEDRTDLHYLPMLRHGRRYGASDLQPKCEYVIFHPMELPLLAEEIDRAVARSIPWSEDYVPEIVEECLSEVIAAAIEQDKGLAGFLG
jgi:hypothetical protein